ncbi:hypothetical protein J3R82DRAFT_8008 [Butyriboletus roseoflavus]|nr:hypothetical protein J3R82DRAFT_8008 [Butyriboletus roseoflavus]
MWSGLLKITRWVIASSPFADFGTVTFTNAVATGTQNYYPSGATIVEISQNNKVLTNVTTNGASVTIQYV